ncbi:hypothetical protein TNCT_593911 [Trichonephila clavata]|uniref:Uncharacterized protein n=1 Tax=Trichonephila clavata TaxID=2740835 RepID=A0A8X6F8G4_TRICU|nr:hypothetical protein TNCT_593911 [Trichonephila clavata]
MDPIESFPNEMFSLESSPSLLHSNEPFEPPLLFQLHSANEQFESPNAEVIQPLPNAKVIQLLPNVEVIQPLPNHELSTFLNSIEIHPADLNTSNEPVSVHYISPHEIISPIQTQSLSKYVTVTGNQHRNLFFLLFGSKTQSLFKNILDFQAVRYKCLKKHAF